MQTTTETLRPRYQRVRLHATAIELGPYNGSKRWPHRTNTVPKYKGIPRELLTVTRKPMTANSIRHSFVINFISYHTSNNKKGSCYSNGAQCVSAGQL